MVKWEYAYLNLDFDIVGDRDEGEEEWFIFTASYLNLRSYMDSALSERDDYRKMHRTSSGMYSIPHTKYARWPLEYLGSDAFVTMLFFGEFATLGSLGWELIELKEFTVKEYLHTLTWEDETKSKILAVDDNTMKLYEAFFKRQYET